MRLRIGRVLPGGSKERHEAAMPESINIARERLRAQGLVAPRFDRPEEVVAWLGAVQAQDFAGAKWSLGLRLKAATDASVERAFDAGAILRTHLLRPTWHFVTPEDIHWLLALTAPHVHAVNAFMYRKLELDAVLFGKSDAVLARTTQAEGPVTRDVLRTALLHAGINDQGDFRLSYLLMHAELEGLICSGPRLGKQFTYTLLETRVRRSKPLARDEALARLARRYFISRGPATIQDFAKWSGLTVTDARHGLEATGAQLQRERIDGVDYWFLKTPSQAKRSAALLLSVYDEYISGYKDRSAAVGANNAVKLSDPGSALANTVVVDGQVVGRWSRAIKSDSALISMNLFEALSDAQHRAIDAEIKRYGRFLQLTARLQSASG